MYLVRELFCRSNICFLPSMHYLIMLVNIRLTLFCLLFSLIIYQDDAFVENKISNFHVVVVIHFLTYDSFPFFRTLCERHAGRCGLGTHIPVYVCACEAGQSTRLAHRTAWRLVAGTCALIVMGLLIVRGRQYWNLLGGRTAKGECYRWGMTLRLPPITLLHLQYSLFCMEYGSGDGAYQAATFTSVCVSYYGWWSELDPLLAGTIWIRSADIPGKVSWGTS